MGLLHEMGYTSVRDFDGGITEWFEAGLPVETDPPPLVTIERPREPRPSFRPPRAWRKRPLAWVAERSIGELLTTWFVINVMCGLVYWLISFLPEHGLREQGQPLAHGASELLEAIYFSFVTGLSIGFGDIVPVGWVRVVAVLQGGACLLVFGAIISKLVSGRQEELTEEIHRIAFEDRLGRVRTNLHLVVSEIQEIGELCVDGRRPSPNVQTRIESAAAVFTGELRAIHDLLYRPQETPDEDVLESILAHLEGGLREFRGLLACIAPDIREAPALAANVRVLAALSEEICGSCVPREYAPQLKVWMDRIQAGARELAQRR